MAQVNRTLTYQGDMLVHDTHDDISMADGAYSWQFDGTTQAVHIPHNTVLNFSNGDWTIEFWMCPAATDVLSGTGRGIYSKRATSAIFASVAIDYNATVNTIRIAVANAAGSAWTVNTTMTLDIGVWQHIAFVRNGANIYGYKNGVRSTLSTAMASAVIFDDGAAATIGQIAVIPISTTTSYGAARFKGLLSNLRVTKGVALYTATTIPIPKSPLVNQGSVTSLLTCQSATFRDNSSYAHILTDVNTPTISYKNPFTTEKSLKFDGTSEYITTPSNAVFAFGTGAFTVEFWIKYTVLPTTGNARMVPLDHAGVSGGFGMFLSSGGIDIYITAGAGLGNFPYTWSLDTWYHVAVVRSGTTCTAYVNGIAIGTNTVSTNFTSPGTVFIGRNAFNALQFLAGYMSNYRITKGTAVYTSNFIPPEPFTDSDAKGASILLFTSGATLRDLSSNGLAITATGGPTVSYENPFDTTLTDESSIPFANRLTNSVYFSSSASSYLSVGTPTAMTGVFTIEYWLYLHSLTDATNGHGIFFQGTTSSNANRVQMSALPSPNRLGFFWENASALNMNLLSSAGSITTKTWLHVAVVSNGSGSTVKVYVNGVESGSTSYVNAPSPATNLYLGLHRSGGVLRQQFDGQISNFRYTRAVVYSGNFTPPTAPLQITQSAGTNIAAITDKTSVRLLTCQNYGEFVDNSIYEQPILAFPTTLTTTIRNTPVTSKFNPFNSTNQTSALTNNYYSAFFNGTSQFLATNAPGFTSSNFTIECWFYLTSNLTFLSPDNAYTATIVGSNVNTGMILYVGAPAGAGSTPTAIVLTGLGAGHTGPVASVTGMTIPIKTWHHVAVSRSGSTFAMWFNGVKQTFTTLTNTGNAFAAGTLAIGYNAENASYRYWFPGYISNLRIVLDNPVYDPTGGDITVPTAPLVVTNRTYLLACQSSLHVDNTTTPFTMTATGATTDKFNPFRTQSDYSVSLNGSSQYLTLPMSTNFVFNGDFTIEAWINPTILPALGDQYWIIGNWARSFYLNVVNTSGAIYLGFAFSSDGTLGTVQSVIKPANIITNTWQHVAAVRVGTTVTLYLDGASIGFGTISITNFNSGTIAIGQITPGPVAGYYFPGYISNLRVVKGTAVYTDNFIPSSSPLTAIANTSLLTCTSSQIRDYSGNSITITNNGTATVSSTVFPPFTTTSATSQVEFPASKLLSTGSLLTKSYLDDSSIFNRTYATYFNGINQYLTGPASVAFAFVSGDFTFECWIWTDPFTNTNGRAIYSAKPDFNFSLDNTGRASFTTSSPPGGSTITGTTNVATSSWNHIAVTRQNGTIRLFVNGVSDATPIIDYDFVGSKSLGGRIGFDIYGVVGGFAGDTLWNGYISNLRFIKGTALYTTTFTPSLTPLTNYNEFIYETSLLAFQDSSATIDNSSYAHALTAVNGPLTTTNIPTRFYSGSFNGSSTSLQVTTTAVTGAWTIEFWVYNASFGGAGGKGYVFNGTTSSDADRVQIGVDSTGQFYYYHENSSSGTFTVNSGATLLSLNKWHHVAVVSDGTTLTLFIDGVSVGSGTIANSPSPGTNFYIGFLRNSGALQYHQGYISDFRYAGASVYTASFTPPTQKLTAIGGTFLLALQTANVTKDNSTNNLTITNNGSVTAVAPISWPTVQKQYSTGVIEIVGHLDDFNPVQNGNVSAYFIGDGYYLSTPSNASFSFGTDDFTLEAWVYPINGGRAADALKYGTIISQFLAGSTGAGSNSWGLGIGMNGGVFSSVTFEADGGSRLDITGLTFALNTWHHLAVVRSSGTLTAYVNGTSIGSSSYASSINNNSSGSVQMGRSAFAGSYSNWLNGYLSNVRVTKGVAVYTGNFTTPTSPLQITQSASANIAAITSTSSVSLLTCQNSDLSDISTNRFSIFNNGGVTFNNEIIPF